MTIHVSRSDGCREPEDGSAGVSAADDCWNRVNVHPSAFWFPPTNSKANLLTTLKDEPLTESYGGYASCPLTTARGKTILAEFDYTMRPRPSFPFIDTTKERTDMWVLKRHGLPALYWNAILKGMA